jgi:hypothetical protein
MIRLGYSEKEDDTPNFHAPKYVEYIWNDHAHAFVDYIKVRFTGNEDSLLTKTDDAIADIWNVLEDEEKTLSIISRYISENKQLRQKI